MKQWKVEEDCNEGMRFKSTFGDNLRVTLVSTREFKSVRVVKVQSELELTLVSTLTHGNTTCL